MRSQAQATINWQQDHGGSRVFIHTNGAELDATAAGDEVVIRIRSGEGANRQLVCIFIDAPDAASLLGDMVIQAADVAQQIQASAKQLGVKHADIKG